VAVRCARSRVGWRDGGVADYEMLWNRKLLCW
jgi:hypothetical protein